MDTKTPQKSLDIDYKMLSYQGKISNIGKFVDILLNFQRNRKPFSKCSGTRMT